MAHSRHACYVMMSRQLIKPRPILQRIISSSATHPPWRLGIRNWGKAGSLLSACRKGVRVCPLIKLPKHPTERGRREHFGEQFTLLLLVCPLAQASPVNPSPGHALSLPHTCRAAGRAAPGQKARGSAVRRKVLTPLRSGAKLPARRVGGQRGTLHFCTIDPRARGAPNRTAVAALPVRLCLSPSCCGRGGAAASLALVSCTPGTERNHQSVNQDAAVRQGDKKCTTGRGASEKGDARDL